MQRGALHIRLHGGEERVTQGRRMGAQAAPPITELTPLLRVAGALLTQAFIPSLLLTGHLPHAGHGPQARITVSETAGEEEQGVCKQIVKPTSVHTL